MDVFTLPIAVDPEVRQVSLPLLDALFQLADGATDVLPSFNHLGVGTDELNSDMVIGCSYQHLPSEDGSTENPLPISQVLAGNVSPKTSTSAVAHLVGELDPVFSDEDVDSDAGTSATSGPSTAKRKAAIQHLQPHGPLGDGFQYNVIACRGDRPTLMGNAGKRDRENEPGNIDDSRFAKKAKTAPFHEWPYVLNWSPLFGANNPSFEEVLAMPDFDTCSASSNEQLGPLYSGKRNTAHQEHFVGSIGTAGDLGCANEPRYCEQPRCLPPANLPRNLPIRELSCFTGSITGSDAVSYMQLPDRLSPLNEAYAPSAYLIKQRLHQRPKPPASSHMSCKKFISDELRQDLLRKLTGCVAVSDEAVESLGYYDTSTVPTYIVEPQEFSQLMEFEVARALAALENAHLEWKDEPYDADGSSRWDKDDYDD